MDRERTAEDDTVKLTVEVPRPVYREAKIYALDLGIRLRSLVIAALEAYMKADRNYQRRKAGGKPVGIHRKGGRR